LLPHLRDDTTGRSINDEGKQINKEPMHPIVDPLLTLQLLAAVLIVLTMPESSTSAQPDKATTPEESEPFELADGNSYVEHAGMAIETDRILSFRRMF